MNQGAVVLARGREVPIFAGVEVRDDIGMTFVEVVLVVNGMRCSGSGRSSNSLCEAIDRAIREIVSHEAKLDQHDIQEHDDLVEVFVLYSLHGQHIAARVSGKKKADTIVVAMLGVFSQMVCDGVAY